MNVTKIKTDQNNSKLVIEHSFIAQIQTDEWRKHELTQRISGWVCVRSPVSICVTNKRHSEWVALVFVDKTMRIYKMHAMIFFSQFQMEFLFKKWNEWYGLVFYLIFSARKLWFWVVFNVFLILLSMFDIRSDENGQSLCVWSILWCSFTFFAEYFGETIEKPIEFWNIPLPKTLKLIKKPDQSSQMMEYLKKMPQFWG